MGYTPKVEWPSVPSQVPSYMDRMEQIEEVHTAAKNSLEKAQKMMATRNPGNKKFQPYQEGDQVWIEGMNLKTLYPSAKLAPKCYGPFKVMKQLSPVVYQIRIPHRWKVHNVFHVNLITPYKETTIHGPNYSRPPPDLVNGEEEFEVEQILNMKEMGRGRKTHYLVSVMDAHILSYFSVFYTDLFDEVFMFESLSLDMIRWLVMCCHHVSCLFSATGNAPKKATSQNGRHVAKGVPETRLAY